MRLALAKGLPVLLSLLALSAVSARGQQEAPAASDVSYGPHGYQRWTTLTAQFSGPTGLGVWLDKERYDTLDVTGGGFVFIAPGAGSAEGRVRLTIRKAQDGKPEGDVIRQSLLSSDKGCISFDLNVAGLIPGEYLATATLSKGKEEGIIRSRAFRVVAAARPDVKTKRVRITIQNPSGAGAISQPLCAAVPIPKGELWQTENARVVAEDGRELPAQIKAQARWDRRGSIRWLSVWCSADHKAGVASTPIFLEYGSQVRPAGQGGPTLLGEKTEGGWRVANGPLKVELTSATGSVLKEVRFDADGNGRFDADEIAWNGEGGGPYLVDDEGNRYEAAADTKPEIVVEENGHEVFVLRAESWYVGQKKFAFHDDPGLCKQITRVRIMRNSPTIDISYTWVMTARSMEARFSDIGFKGRVPGADRVIFGREGDAFAERTTTDSEFFLVQDQWDHYGIWTRYQQTGHFVPGEAARPRYRMLAAGGHAPGWGALTNKKAGVAVGCTDFWQNYPAEVSGVGDALTFHAWPAHGQDHERALDEGDLAQLYFIHESKILNFVIPGEVLNFPARNWHTSKYSLHFAGDSDAIGVSKTHEIKLRFYPVSRPLARVSTEMSAALKPVVAAVGPKAVVASTVMGMVGAHDPARFPEIEDQIEKMFKCEVRLQEMTRDYGKFIFGDGHDSFEMAERRFATYRCWRNTHHNTPRTAWLLYMRSGDPSYYDRALQTAQRAMDVGFCHHSRPELDELPYGPGKRKGALCDYKGLVPWHSGNRNPDYNSMVDFMLYYTYFTGNDRGRDVAREWWECTQAWGSPVSTSRTCSATICSLIELYEDTWDRRILPLLAACYVEQCKGQDSKTGAFNEWQNYAPWIERYWTFTGSEHARKTLVKWADAYLSGMGDLSMDWGGYFNIPAYAYLATGDAKYVRHLNGAFWEQVRSSYRDPGSPLDGLCTTGCVSLSHYYMQRALNVMEAMRAANTTEGWEESDWAIFATPSPETGQYVMRFFVMDEEDKPIRVRIVGVFKGEKCRVTAVAPDGRKALEQEFKPAKWVAHDAQRMAISDDQVIPPDGQKGVYEVRIESLDKAFFNIRAPLADGVKEVYPVSAGNISLRAGRACFEIPRGTGDYVLDIQSQKGGPFPSWAFDDKLNVLACGSLEARSDGTIKLGYPVTIDSNKVQRVMLFSNCGTATGFAVMGKVPPTCVAVSWDRFFNPEEKREALR